jgi:hypothetical protein
LQHLEWLFTAKSSLHPSGMHRGVAASGATWAGGAAHGRQVARHAARGYSLPGILGKVQIQTTDLE